MGPAQSGFLLTYMGGVIVLSGCLDLICSPSNHTMNDRKRQMDESYKRISIRVSPVGIKSLQANSLNNRSSKLNLMENMQISAKDADYSSAQKAKKKGRDLAECMELDLYASTYLRTPAPGVLKHHRTTCVVR
jgi:hypothetical protein